MQPVAAEKKGNMEGDFWASLADSVNPALLQPQKCVEAVVVRLEGRTEPYYILKHPEQKTYLRLSEQDYALYWQMDGRKTIKDLLYYNFMRYGSLPFGRLTTLVDNLRDGYFLADKPNHLYRQVERELTQRAPASRGRRILNSFLYTEWDRTGLDPLFNTLYAIARPLFLRPIQFLLLALILIGGFFFTRLFLNHTYTLIGGSSVGLRVISFFLANLIAIGLHELSHGLTVKHFGRELDRGGFLLYWGFPAFFVDTKDIWLSPRRERVLVSWAGPHSGLIIGALCGLLLTLLSNLRPDLTTTLWASFLYQIGFIAFLSVSVNLNPLLELDGYFILMDWLEMPGLRQRAFSFLKQELWPKIRAAKNVADFIQSLNQTERIYTLFGLAAVFYSIYALGFALYFWQTRIRPPITDLWLNYGFSGRLIVLTLMVLVVVPALYFIGLFIWSRFRDWLEWLARRNLLARPVVLALLIGLPLIAAVLITYLIGGIVLELTTLFIHLAAIFALAGAARQLRGSRFQWTLWAMAVSLAALTDLYLTENTLLKMILLYVTAVGFLAAGLIAWVAVWPVRINQLQSADQLLMSLFLVLGVANLALIGRFTTGSFLRVERSSSALILLTTAALLALTPTILNFWHSRFALPWLLIALAVLMLPWLAQFPALHLALITLWLYAAALYLSSGTLAQFGRQSIEPQNATGERTRLLNGFNHFLKVLFAAYEVVFGRRRLAAVEEELKKFGTNGATGKVEKFSAVNGSNASVLEIATYCRKALLLVVDRLDDLAGTPFTAQAGQAAYDSLPWPEAETLARYVFSQTEWSSQLAEQSINHHNRLAELIRRADIFAGFDQDGLQEVINIGRPWHARAGTIIAEAGAEAERFFLIESGEVGVLGRDVKIGRLTTGGYFGMNALLDSGTYSATYQALSNVTAFVIDRHHFDPLLRADTTLASQVSAGKAERELLKQMPIFAGLSPQQLTTIDAHLEHRLVSVGEVIVEKGQPRSHLFIVFEGQVEADYRNDGQSYEIIGRGEHFGEYALFADTPYQATYRAVIDSHLLLLDEPTFDTLVVQSAEMSHYVEQIGSGRLIETRRRLQLSSMVG
ncbi:MAG: cyclic nucleotide-binding domain-containing protein [Candidatus Promineifilaceae bacterium]